jgi:hypothetical protein
MIFSSPLDRLVFIVAVSPVTSTSMTLSYHDVFKSGTPKISARYCLIACKRSLSVFDVDSADLISRVHLITGGELALIADLAEANGVKKSVDMKTKTIAEINRQEMCFILSMCMGRCRWKLEERFARGGRHRIADVRCGIWEDIEQRA